MLRAIALLAFFLSPSLSAQPPNLEKAVRLLPIRERTLKSGVSITLPIVVEVAGGFHVQSNPASAPNLIATIVELEPNPAVEVGAATYPVGKPYRLQGASNPISTYQGRFEIRLPVKALKPGKSVLKGKLRYQVCDDKNCFFPKSLPVTVDLAIR